jgi:hypothetical protein
VTFLRGEGAERVLTPRFREEVDRFALWTEGSWHVARTDAGAERTVQLFHQLSAEMPGTVSLSLLRVRDGVEWRGDDVALSDAREGIARLRPLLARTGGVVATLWGDARQLALSPQLSLWAWARTARWRAAFRAAGLEECPRVELGDRRWASAPAMLAGSRELDDALVAVAARLGLAAPVRDGRE